MSIDFTKPVKTDNIDTGLLSAIRAHIVALACQLDPTDAGTVSGPPTGARRLLSGGVWERYNGTSWATLSTGYATTSAVAAAYAPLTGGGTSGTWGISITGSAGSVAWGSVSGRPTALSAFTNDINASIAPAWANVTGKPTAVSAWTNDAGYLTSSALSGYAQLASAPTFTGLVKARGGGLGLGQISVTTTTGTPSGMSAGDLVLVY